MKFEGPLTGVAQDAERVLRTLPMWFGIEQSLQEYVRDTERLPTFVARDSEGIVGFITLREHFPTTWEVHCFAVEAKARSQGVGRSLHAHIEGWLANKGVHFLQVKTIAAPSPSKEYAQTRAFYLAIGYEPLEEFPLLWEPGLPVLQLVKALANAA
jgi:GNAT superfamily N-acetyltransferase